MSPSDVIALIAVVIAALALYSSWRTGKQSNDLQRRLVQIEQSREHAQIKQSLQAVLRAGLRNYGPESRRLFIRNSGQGTARNVKVTLDGKSIPEHPAVARDKQEASLIGPDSEISYLLPLTYDRLPPIKFSVTWDDDSGEPGQYNTILTF